MIALPWILLGIAFLCAAMWRDEATMWRYRAELAGDLYRRVTGRSLSLDEELIKAHPAIGCECMPAPCCCQMRHVIAEQRAELLQLIDSHDKIGIGREFT